MDALWRLDPASALAIGRRLDQRSALWLEAPLPPEDALAHGELAGALATALALGESYFKEGGAANWILAAAAYNAGPGRPRRWRAISRVSGAAW